MPNLTSIRWIIWKLHALLRLISTFRQSWPKLCLTSLQNALPRPSISFSHGNKRSLGQILPFSPSPHARLFVRKGLPTSRPHCIGGKGGASEYCSNSAKRHFVPHILARIVATYWMRNFACTFLYLEINARECKSSFVAKKNILLCLWIDQVTVTQLSIAPIRRLNCILCATFFWSL